MSTTAVYVTITPLGPADWASLRDMIAQATGWDSTRGVYSYVESVTDCTLRYEALANAEKALAQSAAQLFEGRLFSDDCDVRWVRQTDGTFRAWMTKESATGRQRVHRLTRRYYLIGTYRTEDQQTTCQEDRYPGKQFEHALSGQPSDRDRAYIEVIEYAVARPDKWPTDADGIEALLNLPAVVGHRFVCVGFGRDAKSTENDQLQGEV